MENILQRLPEGQYFYFFFIPIGTNKCPEGSQCSTFQDTFETAENFCQNLWGGSFEVVDDEEQCMFLWFSGDVNPNDEVRSWLDENSWL